MKTNPPSTPEERLDLVEAKQQDIIEAQKVIVQVLMDLIGRSNGPK